MKIDGIPHHIKDLWPFSRSYLSSSDESDTKDSEQLIYMGLDLPDDGSDISSLLVDTDVPRETPNDSSSEDKACVGPH